jgi:hypothetical protein
MRKLPDGTLPVRDLPSPIFGREKEIEPPPHYLEWTNTQMMQHLRRIDRYYQDIARRVEEFAGDSYESPTGETVLTVVPEYSPAAECITEVLVTGPASTPFTLQLGSRYMELLTDASGKCLLSPVSFILKPDSQRLLTAGAAGSWFLHLSGYAMGLEK